MAVISGCELLARKGCRNRRSAHRRPSRRFPRTRRYSRLNHPSPSPSKFAVRNSRQPGLPKQTQMIKVQRLAKRHGFRLAVKDLSFDAQHGPITGLLGSNGVGKTTNLPMCGVLKPNSGLIVADTVAGPGLPAARHVWCGFVPILGQQRELLMTGGALHLFQRSVLGRLNPDPAPLVLLLAANKLNRDEIIGGN
jgi:hypothetical protein